MTPNSPSWGDVEQFLAADKWRRVPATERGGRRQTHIFFEKQLDDGRMLQTHISHDRSARVSPGRFGMVLREQLEVSRQDFWDAIHTGEPVDRPVPVDQDNVVEHEPWVMAVLVGQLHMSAEEIENLTEAAAIDLVNEHWSRERP